MTDTSPRSSSQPYRSLAADKIIETIAQLHRRIQERFPDSGLCTVAHELLQISNEAVVRSDLIRRPNIALRLVTSLLLLGGLALFGVLTTSVHQTGDLFELGTLLQSVDSSLASAVYIGAAILFLVTIELRLKRRRAFQAIHELRALAHIVDMHQLTKDPEGVMGRGPATRSSPKRNMTQFELERYLDYCSELLSLVSKIGELYVQNLPDPVALDAVNELATLTNGLSRSIWQKIMIIENIAGKLPVKPPAIDRERPLTVGAKQEAAGIDSAASSTG